MKWRWCANPSTASALTHAKLFTNLAHIFEFDGDLNYEFYFKNVTPPYDRRIDGGTQAGEFAQWGLAVQATDRDFEHLLSLSDARNGHANQIAAAVPAPELRAQLAVRRKRTRHS